jgi:hypothetical protein
VVGALSSVTASATLTTEPSAGGRSICTRRRLWTVRRPVKSASARGACAPWPNRPVESYWLCRGTTRSPEHEPAMLRAGFSFSIPLSDNTVQSLRLPRRPPRPISDHYGSTDRCRCHASASFQNINDIRYKVTLQLWPVTELVSARGRAFELAHSASESIHSLCFIAAPIFERY